MIGLDRVDSRVVSPQFGHQADTSRFLIFVDRHSATYREAASVAPRVFASHWRLPFGSPFFRRARDRLLLTPVRSPARVKPSKSRQILANENCCQGAKEQCAPVTVCEPKGVPHEAVSRARRLTQHCWP
jgi:hypothetical protein